MLKVNSIKERAVPELIESIYIQTSLSRKSKFNKALQVLIDACDSDDSDEVNDEHNRLSSANEFFERVISSEVSLTSSCGCLSDFLWDLRNVVNSSDYQPIPEAAIERVEMFTSMIKQYISKNGERVCPNSDVQSSTSSGFNFDWMRLVYFALGVYLVICAISYARMDDMEDFVKKVAEEYNAPLSEVEREFGVALQSDFTYFPIPHTTWYVTKENGQDVVVGESKTFGGCEIYKDKIDQFFYLDFWSGKKSLDEQKMDAMREKMERY